jgi:acyl carrier protein
MKIAEIRSYIEKEILRDPAAQIEPDQDLLLSGSLDSLGIVRLVEYLESRSGVQIPAQDVTLENFGSLQKIAAYIASRQGD